MQYGMNMLTKSDKDYLESRFATKDDLVAMEKRQDAKFATKDDLKVVAKAIVKEVTDYIADTILPILNNHEARLDRLEKRVGGFPPIVSD